MSETKVEMITDDELNEVSGGTNISMAEDIEKGAKEQMPGKKEMPFMCRATICGKTFFISAKGSSRVMCPYCRTVYTVAG